MVQLGLGVKTRHGRGKAGQATPVGRTRAGALSLLRFVQQDVTDGELALAPTPGQSASKHTSKRGRTDDEEDSARGGKKAYRVSLSSLFHESRNEATPLTGESCLTDC